MTQQEILDVIDEILEGDDITHNAKNRMIKELFYLIDKHIKEVIGEELEDAPDDADDRVKGYYEGAKMTVWLQRKRAGL